MGVAMQDAPRLAWSAASDSREDDFAPTVAEPVRESWGKPGHEVKLDLQQERQKMWLAVTSHLAPAAPSLTL